MGNYADINRRHERFPAFNDDEGVKRYATSKESRFKSDDSWILSKNQTDSLVLDNPDANDLKQLRRVNKVVSEKAGSTRVQHEEITKHREHLPEYGFNKVKEVTQTGKTQLFNDGRPKKSTNSYSVQASEHTSLKDRKQPQTLKQEYNDGRSYFVPKYVPSSIIKEEPKSDIDSSFLYESMKKASSSYLLFDQDAEYSEKKLSDPSVKRFQSTERVEMTRGQYKAAIKNKDKKKEKRGVLERSLEGMIQEDQSQLSSNGYFNKG